MSCDNESVSSTVGVSKSRSGISGLDEITHGGLPTGHPTLVYGGPGCGKTILAMEFLANGARDLDEPGLFISFEESVPQLIENFRSLGFDLDELVAQKKLKIGHVALSRGEIVEAGAFTLDGLIIRLKHGIAEVGAKRLVLDSMEAVFAALSTNTKLRAEVARLFDWVREAGITTIVTGERGKGDTTRYGFEDYISDCVLLLDHRISDQISKRRLRIVKYRGSSHATNEYPFLIGRNGLSVIPISSIDLDHKALPERVSTGVGDMDQMLGGKGFFKATTALITGIAGAGKSSVAASFAQATCQRGERCLYFSFEESASHVTRNMQSLGIHLTPWIDKGLLRMRSFRPTFRGLEEHLVSVAEQTDAHNPTCVVMDPITNFVTVGDEEEVKSMLTRILDLLKRRGVTLVMTALTKNASSSEDTEMRLSSMVDTWIVLDSEAAKYTFRRTIRVVKARGMAHSHFTRELVMSSTGLAVRDLVTAEAQA
jgi:circadian clock protein KaiC